MNNAIRCGRCHIQRMVRAPSKEEGLVRASWGRRRAGHETLGGKGGSYSMLGG